ncbi:hypothetical protein OSG_eHP14_00190 [environmental Halophage eHP-14]|nr:hypothetical protein OSG_eHP14_00190 [environmental Halophage eHP-14]
MSFNYPPTRTQTLGSALDTAENRVSELETDDDTGAQTLANARNQRDALHWAVNEFGEDAEIVLSAYTATTRARTLDTLRGDILGDPGPEEIGNWLVAAGVDDAPWIDDKDTQSKAQRTGQLPPALVDWLDRQLDDLNDLSEGN